METPTTWIGLFFSLGVLLISSAGLWIREWRKHQTFKERNGYLKEIAETLKKFGEKQDKMAIKIAETATLVGAQGKHCENTVKSIIAEIGKNTDRIFKLKEKNPIE